MVRISLHRSICLLSHERDLTTIMYVLLLHFPSFVMYHKFFFFNLYFSTTLFLILYLFRPLFLYSIFFFSVLLSFTIFFFLLCFMIHVFYFSFSISVPRCSFLLSFINYIFLHFHQTLAFLFFLDPIPFVSLFCLSSLVRYSENELKFSFV